MLKNIEKQINEFTKNIKELKGCSEMLTYVNSNYISCIKLLMFASSSFSIIVRVMLFFVIATAGLLMSSMIGAILISSTLLTGINIFLFVLILIFIIHCKKLLTYSIQEVKSSMEMSEKVNKS